MLIGVIASAVLIFWMYLASARGLFWLALLRDGRSRAAPESWPSVLAIVPARDEVDCISQSISSLLGQRYHGQFSIILVDDQSRDGTAELAMSAAKALGLDHKLSVVTGAAPPVGWTGKLWSQHQGITLADKLPAPPRYLLLTDADIVHAPDTLLWLVAHAEAGGYALSSFMARLRCESVAERLTIPAFIFFFQMLYPFSWVNDATRRTAAAAGGCILVRRDALEAVGGITAIHGELIDDCALAKKIKAIGTIWIGLTERVQSIRAYPGFSDIGRMVARSAYAQLGYSPLLLLATLAGLALTFLMPVALTIVGDGFDRILGAASWALMAILFQPTLRFYRLSPLYGLVLPITALIYMVFTCASAFQYAMGRGGMWKGRAQANVAKAP